MNPNVVVVLNTGDAVYMPWLASVRSVLEMWYPGVAGGVATADVLVGNVTPSGKLPITFPDGSAARPRFPTDDPGCNPAAIVIPNNSTGTGANDGNCPLYPGVFMPRGRAMTVSFKVTNSGSVKGDEVPQVYVGSPASPPVPMAVRTLAGFERVSLHPGQTKHVTIHVARRAFQFWSVADHAWMTAWGVREIAVGASSRDIRLRTTDAPLKPPAEEVPDSRGGAGRGAREQPPR